MLKIMPELRELCLSPTSLSVGGAFEGRLVSDLVWGSWFTSVMWASGVAYIHRVGGAWSWWGSSEQYVGKDGREWGGCSSWRCRHTLTRVHRAYGSRGWGCSSRCAATRSPVSIKHMAHMGDDVHVGYDVVVPGVLMPHLRDLFASKLSSTYLISMLNPRRWLNVSWDRMHQGTNTEMMALTLNLTSARRNLAMAKGVATMGRCKYLQDTIV